MKKITGILATIILGASLAQAGVALNMFNGFFYESDGVTPLSLNSTIVLLADADNDGFGDLTQATSAWTADAGDILLGRWALNENAAGPGSSFDAVIFDYAGLTAGRDLMLVWYDKTYGAGDVGPGESVSFGAFRTDDAISVSDTGWFVPADGATINLNFATISAGGDSADSLGVASFQTIPEPASAVLALIGGGLAYAIRRRGHRFVS